MRAGPQWSTAPSTRAFETAARVLPSREDDVDATVAPPRGEGAAGRVQRWEGHPQGEGPQGCVRALPLRGSSPRGAQLRHRARGISTGFEIRQGRAMELAPLMEVRRPLPRRPPRLTHASRARFPVAPVQPDEPPSRDSLTPSLPRDAQVPLPTSPVDLKPLDRARARLAFAVKPTPYVLPEEHRGMIRSVIAEAPAGGGGGGGGDGRGCGRGDGAPPSRTDGGGDRGGCDDGAGSFVAPRRGRRGEAQTRQEGEEGEEGEEGAAREATTMRLRGTLAVGRERRSDGLGKHARDERMTWRWIQNRIRNRAASGAPSGLAGGSAARRFTIRRTRRGRISSRARRFCPRRR